MRWPWTKEKIKRMSPEEIKSIIAQEEEAKLARNNELCEEIVRKALNSLGRGKFATEERGLLVKVKCHEILSYANQRQVANMLHEQGYTCEVDESWQTMYVWFK